MLEWQLTYPILNPIKFQCQPYNSRHVFTRVCSHKLLYTENKQKIIQKLRAIHTILSIVSHIMSNNHQKCVTITRCPSIEGEANFSLQRLHDQLKRVTIVAPKEIKESHTTNIALVSSIVFSPRVMICRRMPSFFGRENLVESRLYSIIETNSGFSTSSNGWSHATIHSMSSFWNFAWSQGSCNHG